MSNQYRMARATIRTHSHAWQRQPRMRYKNKYNVHLPSAQVPHDPQSYRHDSPVLDHIATSKNHYRTMDAPPPSYEEAIRQEPGNSNDHGHGYTQGRLPLVLQGESIRDLSTGRVLYKLSRQVTSLPKPGANNSSSVTFERVEYNTTRSADKKVDNPKEDTPAHTEPESQSQSQSQHKHLFYLVHPADAQYRPEVPGYYITRLDADAHKTQGNMQFETRGTVLHGTEFRALVSPGRTWAHKPLFSLRGKIPLFIARREGLKASQYTWREPGGKELGHDFCKNGESHGLVITSPMDQEGRDALVALWVLRVWHDVAESPKAKRDGQYSLTFYSVFVMTADSISVGPNDTSLGCFRSWYVSKEGWGSWCSWGSWGWCRWWLLNRQQSFVITSLVCAL